MDNGALVFLVIIEAIVIVWLASKLKQYQKFDRLLSADASAAGAPENRAPVAAAPAPVQTPAAPSPMATSAADDLDLLDMPGVDPESNIEEAKRVQLVMARCRYAEFYLEQLDDDYERSQFERIINNCQSTARGISDPFFRSSALQAIIVLLHRAGWEAERDVLLAEVDDELVREQTHAELTALA